MSKRKKTAERTIKGSEGRLRKTVFCPECGMSMRYVKTKPHQKARDYKGRLIRVSRVFFGCGKCMTIVHFSYREDGKPGDLYRKMQILKSEGIEAEGLGGKMGEIFDI
jgi:RNase P subunit RPR2